MKAIILAAGFAVRLQPLTTNTAKPLLEVAGRKMVDYLVDCLDEVSEIDSIYIVTNEKFYNDFCAWKDKCTSKKRIVIINDGSTTDDDKLGAIGDLDFTIRQKRIHDDLIIVAGDNLFDMDINDFICFSKPRGTTISAYDVGSLEAARRFGVVSVGENNIIEDFAEKPYNPRSSLAAMCLYYFPKDKIRLIEDYLKEGNSPDQPGKYISWLYKKEDVYGYVFKGEWFDIGSFECYEEANRSWGSKVKNRE